MELLNLNFEHRCGVFFENRYIIAVLARFCLFTTPNIARAQSPVVELATSVIENADERIASRLLAVFELLGAAPSIHSVPGSNFCEPDLLTSNVPNRPIPKFGGWVSGTGAYWRPEKKQTSGYNGYR